MLMKKAGAGRGTAQKGALRAGWIKSEAPIFLAGRDDTKRGMDEIGAASGLITDDEWSGPVQAIRRASC
jgi:hypothetical protein